MTQQLEIEALVASIHYEVADREQALEKHCNQRIQEALRDCAEEVGRLREYYEGIIINLKNAPNPWEQRARLEYAEAITWKQRAANLEEAAAHWREAAAVWKCQAGEDAHLVREVMIGNKMLKTKLIRAQFICSIAVAVAAALLLVVVAAVL